MESTEKDGELKKQIETQSWILTEKEGYHNIKVVDTSSANKVLDEAKKELADIRKRPLDCMEETDFSYFEEWFKKWFGMTEKQHDLTCLKCRKVTPHKNIQGTWQCTICGAWY